MHSNSHGSEEKLAVHGCAGLADATGRAGPGRRARHGIHRPRRARPRRRRRRGRGRRGGRPGDRLEPRPWPPRPAGRRCRSAIRACRSSKGTWATRSNEQPRPRPKRRGSTPSCSTSTTVRRRSRPSRTGASTPSPACASARQALRSDGVLAVWSTFADARFTARLREAGFAATEARAGGRRHPPPSRLDPRAEQLPGGRFPIVKVALWGQNAHPLTMAKTWVPKTGIKSARAFAKAMRALQNTKGSRGNYSRPR